jgi:outer membrane protein OmpA-like peptidoglycan-associated protein
VILPSSFPEIELIANYLKKNPSAKVYVVGHTDNTGNYNHNLTLSEQRALSVKKALVNKYKINEQRLHAVGVGPVAPESKNTSEEGRKKNRRVEIVLNEK